MVKLYEHCNTLKKKREKNKNIPLKCSKCLKLNHSDCPLLDVLDGNNEVNFSICSTFQPKEKLNGG